jgi:4-diphosphocytidyl-2-C-methyl-D-erythritol kinase
LRIATVNRKTRLSIEAPAKINLHLEITGRRADGYHDLRSLFAAISLCDRLTVSFGPESADDRLEPLPDGLDPHDNTVRKAIETFRRETGSSESVAVRLEKKIPIGSGLGGGSSDAAAMLRLLNELYDHPLSDDALLKLGAAIGSDVPFFLRSACAVVEGRGEMVFPVAAAACSIVLLVPDFSINTAEAYGWYDQLPMAPPAIDISRDDIVKTFTNAPPAEWNFFNSFSSVLFARYPVLCTLQKRLRAEGALFTGVSGSGSSNFGIFSDDAKARAAMDRIDGSFRFAALVKTLDVLPRAERGLE